jgi:hypothetical protein
MGVVVTVALLALPALAQGEEGRSIVIYGLGAGMDGTVGVGPITAEIDLSASDIFSNLEMGGMAAYRNDTGRWAWGAEAIYMGLGNADTAADVELDEWIVAATAGYELSERFDLVGGIRYMDVTSEITVPGPHDAILHAETGADWVDPFVGGRLNVPVGAKSSIVLQGTVGGFGIGSDLSIDLGAMFEWSVSERTSLILGYRALDVDYEDGEGLDRFKYDVTSQGPALGLRIRL